MVGRRFRYTPQTEYTDVEFVEGIVRKDVFHNTYLTLWENIERGKIHVEHGQIVGRDGEPFVGTLSTYLMAIARLKYKEWTRTGGREQHLPAFTDDETPLPEDLIVMAEWLEDDERKGMREVIAETISVMSPRCREILTKFYAEGKRLDDILRELTSFTSKDALKSAKSKCLGRLREATRTLYDLRRKRDGGQGHDSKKSQHQPN